ncbi:hypothetical protein [Streptomyces zhihengii]
MTATHTPAQRPGTTPLTTLAASLSLGSLIWTTWSLFDLLGVGLAGFTVAACADAVWGAVIYAEYRGVRVAGKKWPVVTFGWIALLAVAALLVWHGIAKNNPAMAAAGPLLPIGAKAIWVLALAALRDPAALTDDELATLARMERGMAFEEAQHRFEMRRREMNAERQMSEVAVDFDIELMRQSKTRELTRRRPLDVTPHHDAHRITRTIDDAPQTDALTAASAPHPALPSTGRRTDAEGEVADRAHDAPLMPALAQPAAAPRITGEAPRLTDLSKAAAVRAVRDAEPGASAPQIVKRLASHGITATDAYVRTVLSRTKQSNSTEGGYL